MSILLEIRFALSGQAGMIRRQTWPAIISTNTIDRIPGFIFVKFYQKLVIGIYIEPDLLQLLLLIRATIPPLLLIFPENKTINH